jgi:hypothetical protein
LGGFCFLQNTTPPFLIHFKYQKKIFGKFGNYSPSIIEVGYIYSYMKDLIKRIIKEEFTEKEIIDEFKKLIGYFEPSVIRDLFISPSEIDENKNRIGGVVSVLANQRLEKKYPGYRIQFEVEDETLYYYLVDKDGNDILKYSHYL